MSSEQYYFTIKEVAEIAQVHQQTVYRWLQRGALTGIRLGGRWRIPMPALVRIGITEDAINSYYRSKSDARA